MSRAAFIGAGVALLCFLPPILHFVTGPLSPAIGGFVGGMQLPGRRPSFGAIAGMAGVMTLVLATTITALTAIGLTIHMVGRRVGVKGRPALFVGLIMFTVGNLPLLILVPLALALL